MCTFKQECTGVCLYVYICTCLREYKKRISFAELLILRVQEAYILNYAILLTKIKLRQFLQPCLNFDALNFGEILFLILKKADLLLSLKL